MINNLISTKPIRKPIEIRFWDRVDKQSDDECWNWLGAKNVKGYGQLWFDTKMCPAHRISYILHNGEISEWICVLHHCDNPSCVNPNHLFLGTYKDNALDRDNKNRGFIPIGDKCGTSKLTWGDIEKIRALSGKVTQENLAKMFGVTRSTISRIVRNVIWRI